MKKPKHSNKRKETKKMNSIKEEEKENLLDLKELSNFKFENSSEAVVSTLLDKIISLSISKSFSRNVDKQLPDNCYNFIKNTLDLLIINQFVSFDKEETESNELKNNILSNVISADSVILKNENDELTVISDKIDKIDFQSENCFFNNYIRGHNDWNIVDEPKANQIDRYSSTMINYTSKVPNFEMKNFQTNKRKLEEIEEENILKQSGGNPNLLNINRIDNQKKATVKHIESSEIDKKKKGTPNDTTNNNNSIPKVQQINKRKNLQEIMNQFSFHEIEVDNDHYVEGNEVDFNELRRELDEKVQKALAEEKLTKKAKFDVDTAKKAENEKFRQYVGKKISTAANGEIVFLKGVKLDKLSTEFMQIRTNYKAFKNPESSNKGNKKRNLINKTKEDNNEEANNKETLDSKSNTQLLPKIDSTKQKNIKNNNNVDQELKNPIDLLDKNMNLTNISKKFTEGPIVPSGSNFNLMNMEVGVSIKEDEKYKTGGNDFFKKYNKFSIATYNQKLKETTTVNSFFQNQPVEFSNPVLTNTDYNNNFNFNETYNTASGGFINNTQQQNTMLNTLNSKVFPSSINNVYNLYTSTSNNFLSRKMETSINPLIKLSSGFNSSLMTTMDKLNLVTENEGKISRKTKNYFKRKENSISKVLLKPLLTDMNKFTAEIMNNRVITTKSKENIYPSRKPGKPGNKEISKELGIRKKILRTRAKGLVQIKSVEGDNMDFFKQ